MPTPDYVRASAYARHRLQHELPAELLYHSLAHTRDDVVPAVARLTRLVAVSAESWLLLHTAAWFHDIGFTVGRDDHEQASAAIAAAALPQFGYSPQQVEQVVGMIAATRLPQGPRTPLEELLADADLDALGRPDFLQGSLLLRAELGLFAAPVPDREWYARQLDFLRGHRYWSEAARTLREPQKQRNIALLERLVAHKVA